MPVALSLDTVVSNETPINGFVQIRPFRIEVLRRQAVVKKFKMNFADSKEQQKITGLVHFKNNDYKINLKIFGTVSEPKYLFQSEPPLPDRDILAIVLFGATPADLEAEDLKSVGEAQAAIVDGAISLLSMYYLVSTPVESVGYNPQTRMFTARVSLREGLSMTLGSDTSNRKEVGLRKRLGRGWRIQTSASQDNKKRAMLKWGKRY